MFKDYIKDGHIIKATERGFEVIYKNQGYVELNEELEAADEFLQEEEELIQDIEEAHEVAIQENETNIAEVEISLEDMKVEKLKELAKERNIEGYSKMKKEELIAALAGE